MAAYSALASLLHILNDILLPLHNPPPKSHNDILLPLHDPPPKSHQLESLRENVNFLLGFLENSPNPNYSIEDLEREIRDAAYAAEDLIESHISNQLLLESHFYGEEENSNCVRQLLSCFQKSASAVLNCQLFVSNSAAGKRREISYESFEGLYSNEELGFEKKRNIGKLLLQSPASIDAKLVFAAQRCLWYCILDFCPRSYYKHCRMIYSQGYEADQYFLHTSNLSALTGIQLEMVNSIFRTIQDRSNYYETSKRKVFYNQLCYSWNVLYALRQRLLVPEDKDMYKVMHNFHSVMEKVIKIKSRGDAESLPTAGHFLPASSPSRLDSRIRGRSIVVGFDTESVEIKNQLLRDSSKVEIVSIVGMGGIGKTTLARKVYADSYIDYHFDICAWVTVSQEYSVRKILLGLLVSTERRLDEMHKESDERLAEYLYKSLKGRRYIIVMDDVWDVEVWDLIRRYLPHDDNNGSRILLTTRLLDVAVHANSSTVHQMRFLTKEESWSLLSQKVFAEDKCPPGLTEIGKEIAHNCGGLPLAIVVAGGLLSKVSRTKICWRDVADNLMSLVAKDDKKCLKVLFLSYKRLPHHLKACFLYMGVFPEDFEIPVSKLIHLWVAEGFLKPHISKNLELVAEEYLGDLIERSLISVSTWSRNGKVKTCSIHDLLRELCIRNAEKENLFHVANLSSGVMQDSISNQRRLSIHPDVWYAEDSYYSIDSTSSRARSLLRTGRNLRFLMDIHLPFRLLRVLDVVIVYFSSFPSEIIELVNLRYLALTYNESLPPSLLNLWNLQTIVHHSGRALRHGPLLPIEIWMMPKLRHLCFTSAWFPDFLDTEYFVRNSLLLENLQTLTGVRDFQCSKDILKRIPNLKKLGISYAAPSTTDWSSYQVKNLVHLHQLETLKFSVIKPRFDYMPRSENLAFPLNLKSLTLRGCRIPWKRMTTIGALPNLEVLKLKSSAFQGLEWQPIEGEFLRLRFLLMEEKNLVHWRADSTHFPILQHLIIRSCSSIEIPSSIGDISTLQMIELFDCGPSAVISAKKIQEEQQDMDNDYLQIRIGSKKKMKDVNKSQILR